MHPNERKKRCAFGWVGSEEDLRGIGGKETIIRIHSISYIFFKNQVSKKQNEKEKWIVYWIPIILP